MSLRGQVKDLGLRILRLMQTSAGCEGSNPLVRSASLEGPSVCLWFRG